MRKGFCFWKIFDHTIDLKQCFLVCDLWGMFVFKQRFVFLMVLRFDYIVWGSVIQE
jgi:hypothetical protein